MDSSVLMEPKPLIQFLPPPSQLSLFASSSERGFKINKQVKIELWFRCRASEQVTAFDERVGITSEVVSVYGK